MEPAFKNGANIIVRKYFLGSPNPKRSAVVLYKKDQNGGSDYIGRVIALPKESFRFYKGNLYIDDNVEKYRVDEEYLPKGTKTYINEGDGDSPDWQNVGAFSYLILPDKRSDKTININEQIIHRDNIKGVVISKF